MYVITSKYLMHTIVLVDYGCILTRKLAICQTTSFILGIIIIIVQLFAALCVVEEYSRAIERLGISIFWSGKMFQTNI